ncbi:MAG: hypothetical protein WCF18_24545, partial [Chthoniobacteraceae bacterium]
NYENAIDTGNDSIAGAGGDDVLIGDTGLLYIPSVLNNAANTARTDLSIEGELNRVTAGLAGYMDQGNGNVRKTAYGQIARDTYQERGGKLRVSEHNEGNDTIDAGAGDDIVVGDHAAVGTPFIAKEEASQPGTFTGQLDVKGLIKNFGHALPNESLTRKLVVHSTNTVATSNKHWQGTQGHDIETGGDGGDILLGTPTDSLSDNSGKNFVDNDPKQRSTPRLVDGTDYQLSTTIRNYLQALAGNSGVKLTAGKDARIGAPIRDAQPATAFVGDPTAGGVGAALPTTGIPAALPTPPTLDTVAPVGPVVPYTMSVAPSLAPAPETTTGEPPAKPATGLFARFLRKLG